MIQKMSDKCTGCGACVSKCPLGAIQYVTDAEGFYKAIVNGEKCVNCGLCLKICPLETAKKGHRLRSVFACRNMDEEIVKQSSSGGVFSLLAHSILNQGGCVAGCVWDGTVVRHTVTDTIDGLNRMRKSKYLQSDMSEVYALMEERLRSGKKVLFCGTPCQVAGVKSAFGDKYTGLYTADFICHGVPSPKVFQKYVGELAKKQNSRIAEVCFRDKNQSWKALQMTVRFDNGCVYSETAANDAYYRGFLCNLSLSKNCGQCGFNCVPRSADITLGDFWGAGKFHKRFDDDLGVSCVVVNSENGAELFSTIQDKLLLEESTCDHVMADNPFLNGHCKLHKRRAEFFRCLDYEPFDALVNRCLKPTVWEWILEVAKHKISIFRRSR